MVCGRVKQSTRFTVDFYNNLGDGFRDSLPTPAGGLVIMGEDRVAFVEKNVDALTSRQRHSSVLSSCSEDADSESTSTGYTQTPDEEKEEELEYGPGIVNKLKTRYLSIALKQNRGMRRSCSMENLLDQDKSSRNFMFSPDRFSTGGKNIGEQNKNHPWGHLKRAKSMDTLLLELQPEPPPSPIIQDMNGTAKKEPKIVRRRDGGLLRTIPTICDEELPKPDTVKTYKRMFEPAESRRGSCSRRPPVLRASAKSGSMTVSKVTNNVSPSAKVNGTVLKSKLSAKQESSTLKAQQDKDIITNNINNIQPLLNGDSPKPVCNGNFVKAIPLKITDNRLCNGKVEKVVEKITTKPHVLPVSKKEIHQNGSICNGNSNPKELIKSEKIEEVMKPDLKKLVNKVVNGTESPVTNAVNGIKTKPKVPPNRPAFVKNVRHAKLDQNGVEKNNLIPKLKPVAVTTKKEVETSKLGNQPKIEKLIPTTPVTNNETKKDPKNIKPTEIKDEEKIVVENNLKNMDNIPAESEKQTNLDNTESTPTKEPEKAINGMVNGYQTDVDKESTIPRATVAEPKPESKPVKKQQSADAITTSMVFDFRGKDVVSHVAVLPTPFGCKALHPKKRPLLVDGKEIPAENGTASDDEDEYHMDYSVPPPCGVIFEGENVKIGKGSILCTRNKELKIQFDDNVDDNTFVYPSESSLLEDGEQQSLSPSPPPIQSTPSKLKSNPAIGSSGEGGLSTYTPSVLRTMDNFEPGMFRPPPPAPSEKDDVPYGEEENTEMRKEDKEMLKPADPCIISSWSLSAGTSDLLF